MAAPLIALGADVAESAPKPAVAQTNAVSRSSGAPMDAVKESLLKGLRPENLKPGELESLQREMRVLFGPGMQFKDLSTLEMVRLLDRVMSAEGEPGQAGRPPNDGRGLGGRPEFDRRTRGGGPPPGGRRGGFRGGVGRAVQPFSQEPYPDTGQFVSPFAQAAFDEESLQDPEIVIRSYRTMIARFNQQRKNMAVTHYRLGQFYEKLKETNEAEAQYHEVIKHFSDIEDVKTDCEKALEKLEGNK